MTVLITLTTAGTDTGPFDLYSNVDGYVSAFETGVSKAALLAGYSSALVPNGTTTIRIKSTGICVNYIDVLVITTTTTTSSTTSTSSTTTTTTTTFNCDTDCRNWEYLDASIPIEGDTITYYSCIDGTTQSISLSNGDPTASFCNCNTVGTPTSLNGTTLTEIGICVTTTTTTTVEPTTTTTTTTTGAGGTILIENTTSGSSSIGGITPTWFILPIGFPITNGNSEAGTHTGNTGVFTIDIATADSPSIINIFVNGLLVDCITVTTAGNYNTASLTIAGGDFVLIRYQNGTC